ncbi:MAG: DUF4160 domain-containing protein [Bacilli bacterium]|nr:DUF4160 domain-containing protein [Bacilli bacterium]
MPPTISQFYGIRLVMYLKNKEHNPPHIHAYYGDDEAKFLISNGELYEGHFPKRGSSFVKEFIIKNQKELTIMWETEKYKKLPPIK